MPYQINFRGLTEREYYAAMEGRVPGAHFSDVPLKRGHLPGIPYSYYEDEAVMIRARTVALIDRMNAEAAAEEARRRRHRRRGGAQDDDEEWDQEGGWIGVDE